MPLHFCSPAKKVKAKSRSIRTVPWASLVLPFSLQVQLQCSNRRRRTLWMIHPNCIVCKQGRKAIRLLPRYRTTMRASLFVTLMMKSVTVEERKIFILGNTFYAGWNSGKYFPTFCVCIIEQCYHSSIHLTPKNCKTIDIFKGWLSDFLAGPGSKKLTGGWKK